MHSSTTTQNSEMQHRGTFDCRLLTPRKDFTDL
jgi:hypothetical protein